MQKYLIDIEILSVLLKRFMTARLNVRTEEEKLLLEAEAVILLEKLLDLEFKLTSIKVLDYPSSQEVFGAYSQLETLLTVALIKLRKLTELFLQHYDINKTQLLALSESCPELVRKRAL